MAKRQAPSGSQTTPTDAKIPVVGPREPCPCGSGRRYKACHGRAARAAHPFVARPFAGLAAECDWVALREFVPAGTAVVRLAEPNADRDVQLATLLPMVARGLVRPDGGIMVGLQVAGDSGDPSRDYASVIEELLDSEPGTVLTTYDRATTGPRLQDILDVDTPLAVTLHADFAFWADAVEDPTGSVASSIERAASVIAPTALVPGTPGAYWCEIGDRRYLRLLRPEAEDALVAAIARLHVRQQDTVGPDTRYIGAFRAHGLLVSVWDLPPDATAESIAEPVATFASRLDEALADSSPLTTEERSARAGLLNRQRTLRPF